LLISGGFDDNGKGFIFGFDDNDEPFSYMIDEVALKER